MKTFWVFFLMVQFKESIKKQTFWKMSLFKKERFCSVTPTSLQNIKPLTLKTINLSVLTDYSSRTECMTLNVWRSVALWVSDPLVYHCIPITVFDSLSSTSSKKKMVPTLPTRQLSHKVTSHEAVLLFLGFLWIHSNLLDHNGIISALW